MAKRKTLSQLAKDLKPYISEYASGSGGGGIAAGGGGVTDHGRLTGLNGDDHRHYLTMSRANQLYVQLGDISALTVHDITGDYHTASGLDTGEVIAADSATTFSWRTLLLSEITAIGGDGITISGNTISVDVGDGLALSAGEVLVNEAFAFDWLGEHTFADDIGGDADEWQITAEGDATFKDIQADTLYVDTFVADVNLALAGSQYITKSGATLSRNFTTPATTGTLYVYDSPGLSGSEAFDSGDTVRLRYINRTAGLIVGWVAGTVTNYIPLADGEQSWTFTRTEGDAGRTILAGMWALDFGVSGDGYIESTALGSDTPRIDIGTWSGTTDNQTRKVVLGNLDGISHATLSPDGFGLFADNVALEGELLAASGKVLISEAGGINITAHTAGAISTQNSIEFRTDTESTSAETRASALTGARFTDGGGDSINFTWLTSAYGSGYGSDEAWVWIDALGAGSKGARINLTSKASDDGLPAIYLAAESVDSNSGSIRTLNRFIVSEDVTPDGIVNLGSAGAPFNELHVNTLFAGITSSLDTGHNHNDLYYTESEVDALLNAKASTSHTHAYVTSASLTAHTTDNDIHREINDAGNAVTDLWSASKIGTAIASATTGLALTSSLLDHTSDADKHREINDAGSAVTDLWSAYQIGSELTALESSILAAAAVAASSDLADAITAHSADDDAHHDPVTLGNSGNLTLNTQVIDLAGDLDINGLTVGSPATFSDDVNFTHFKIDSVTGNLESTDPAYSIVAGLKMTPSGDLFAGNAKLRGEFGAAVFAFKETAIHGGADEWSPGGGFTVEENATISAGTVTLTVSGAGYSSAPRLLVGYKILMRGIVDYSRVDTSTGYSQSQWAIGRISHANPNSQPTAEIWMEVTGATYNSEAETWAYECDILSSNVPNGADILAGSAVASYLDPVNTTRVLGGLRAIANEVESPRFEAYTIGDEPENGEFYRKILIGRLDSSAIVSGIDYGFLAGPNLDDANSAYFRADSTGVEMDGGTFRLTDDNGDPAVVIDPESGVNIYVGPESFNALNYVIHSTDEEIGEISVGGLLDVDTDIGEYFGFPKRYAQSQYIPTLSIFSRYHGGGIEMEGRAIDLYDANDAAPVTTEEGSRLVVEALSPLTEDFQSDFSGQLLLQVQPDSRFGHPYQSLAMIRADDAAIIGTDRVRLNSSGTEIQIEGGIINMSGKILIPTLPTSSAGLQIGQLYNDSGTLKVAT